MTKEKSQKSHAAFEGLAIAAAKVSAIIANWRTRASAPTSPCPDFGGRTASFDRLTFTYDAAQDRYLCPQGTPLPFDRLLKPQRVMVYRADAATCNACPLKDRCTESMHGRTVSRSYDEDYVERMHVYHQTEACKKARRKRQVWVESFFAEAKAWHGLRRFRLRRLWRVNSEALLIAAGQNLKRLLSWQGWGHRPWPGGRWGWPSPPPCSTGHVLYRVRAHPAGRTPARADQCAHGLWWARSGSLGVHHAQPAV